MSDSRHHVRLTVHSLVTFGTTIGIVGLRLVRSILVANLLQASLRGIYGALTLVPDFLSSFADLGFGPATIYYVAKEKYDLRRVMGGVLIFGGLVGLLVIGLTYLILDSQTLYDFTARLATNKDANEDAALFIDNFRPLVLLGGFLLIFMNLGGSFIMARGRIYALNVINVVGVVVPLALFVAMWAIRPEAPLSAAMWAWVMGLVVVAALPFLLLRRDGAYPPKPDMQFIRQGVRYGLASHFANFFQKALRRMDFFFIMAWCTPAELGYYTMATMFAEMMLMVPESVAVPFIPIVFGMDKKNSERFTPVVVKTIFTFMVFASIPVLALGHPFFAIALPDYVPGFGALALLLPGMIGLAIYPFLKAELFKRDRAGSVSLLVSVSLVVNFVLNWVTIPHWGIYGAAASSTVSYLLSLFLVYIFYCRLSGAHPVRSLVWSRQEIGAIWRFVMKKIGRGETP